MSNETAWVRLHKEWYRLSPVSNYNIVNTVASAKIAILKAKTQKEEQWIYKNNTGMQPQKTVVGVTWLLHWFGWTYSHSLTIAAVVLPCDSLPVDKRNKLSSS